MSDVKEKQPCQQHSGSGPVYSIEARTISGAKEIDGQMFTTEWSKIRTENGSIGVPSRRFGIDYHGTEYGFLSYQQAQAIRWWFLAIVDSVTLLTSFETRLIEHRLSFEVKIQREEEFDHLGGLDHVRRVKK